MFLSLKTETHKKKKKLSKPYFLAVALDLQGPDVVAMANSDLGGAFRAL